MSGVLELRSAELHCDDCSNSSNTDWEFKHICIPRFIESFEEVSVHTLEDIVKFNTANNEKCLPEREFLFHIIAIMSFTNAGQHTPSKMTFSKHCTTMIKSSMSNTSGKNSVQWQRRSWIKYLTKNKSTSSAGPPIHLFASMLRRQDTRWVLYR